MALRVPLFAVVTTGLGVLAHVAGGGQPPGWSGLALILAATALLGRAMAPVEQSLPRLLGTLLWVQLVIHLALSQGGTPGVSAGCHSPTPIDPGGWAGGVADQATGSQHSLHGSVWMWLAHGVAAVAVAAWMRRGEAASWRALRRVIARLLPPPRPLPVSPTTTSTWVDQSGDARLDPPPVLLGHRWRGPPLRPRACAVPPIRPAHPS